MYRFEVYVRSVTVKSSNLPFWEDADAGSARRLLSGAVAVKLMQYPLLTLLPATLTGKQVKGCKPVCSETTFSLHSGKSCTFTADRESLCDKLAQAPLCLLFLGPSAKGRPGLTGVATLQLGLENADPHPNPSSNDSCCRRPLHCRHCEGLGHPRPRSPAKHHIRPMSRLRQSRAVSHCQQMLRMATAGLDSYCPACLLPCATPVAAPAAPLHHPSRSEGSKSGKTGRVGGSNRDVVVGGSGRDVTAAGSDDREVIATQQQASDAQQHLLALSASAEAGNVSEANSEQLLAWGRAGLSKATMLMRLQEALADVEQLKADLLNSEDSARQPGQPTTAPKKKRKAQSLIQHPALSHGPGRSSKLKAHVALTQGHGDSAGDALTQDKSSSTVLVHQPASRGESQAELDVDLSTRPEEHRAVPGSQIVSHKVQIRAVPSSPNVSQKRQMQPRRQQGPLPGSPIAILACQQKLTAHARRQSHMSQCNSSVADPVVGHSNYTNQRKPLHWQHQQQQQPSQEYSSPMGGAATNQGDGSMHGNSDNGETNERADAVSVASFANSAASGLGHLMRAQQPWSESESSSSPDRTSATGSADGKDFSQLQAEAAYAPPVIDSSSRTSWAVDELSGASQPWDHPISVVEDEKEGDLVSQQRLQALTGVSQPVLVRVQEGVKLENAASEVSEEAYSDVFEEDMPQPAADDDVSDAASVRSTSMSVHSPSDTLEQCVGKYTSPYTGAAMKMQMFTSTPNIQKSIKPGSIRNDGIRQ
ncbi:hypothetical protein WJX82_008410 [Trebouxia sp. C0006]